MIRSCHSFYLRYAQKKRITSEVIRMKNAKVLQKGIIKGMIKGEINGMMGGCGKEV